MAKIILLLLVAVMALPTGVLAAEPDNGRIEVQVVNGTKDGAAVAGQEISYKLFDNGADRGGKKVRTDDKGKFVVDGLSTKSSYQVTVTFQEADYESEKVSFDKGATSNSVKVTVYDATGDESSISVDIEHMIVYPEENGLLVKVYSMFNNEANRTYVGSKVLAPDKKETLRFFLPEGASEMEYALDLMGCCVIPDEGKLSDTMAVLPGAKEILYSYTVPYSSSKYTLTEKFNYPTANFELLIAGDSINVAGGNLAPGAPVTIEGKKYSRFSLKDLAAGETLKLELSGLPEVSRRQTFRWLLWGLAAVVLVGGTGYLMKRRTPSPRPVKVEGNLEQTKRRLISEIARLDDSFDGGKIAEDAYQKQRTARKAQLLRVMQQLKNGGRERS